MPLYLAEPAAEAAHDALARVELRSGLARHGREGALTQAQLGNKLENGAPDARPRPRNPLT